MKQAIIYKSKGFVLTEITDVELAKFLKKRGILDEFEVSENTHFYPDKDNPEVILFFDNQKSTTKKFICTDSLSKKGAQCLPG